MPSTTSTSLELEPTARFELRQRVARSLAWRGWPAALGHFNPGVRPITLDRDYDLLVFVCMNVWDLLYLNAIRGWRERRAVKVCFMVEFYAGQAQSFGYFLRLLSEFDQIALSFSGSVAAVGHATGKPCHHVPARGRRPAFHPVPSAAVSRDRRPQRRPPIGARSSGASPTRRRSRPLLHARHHPRPPGPACEPERTPGDAGQLRQALPLLRRVPGEVRRRGEPRPVRRRRPLLRRHRRRGGPVRPGTDRPGLPRGLSLARCRRRSRARRWRRRGGSCRVSSRTRRRSSG